MMKLVDMRDLKFRLEKGPGSTPGTSKLFNVFNFKINNFIFFNVFFFLQLNF